MRMRVAYDGLVEQDLHRCECSDSDLQAICNGMFESTAHKTTYS